MRTAHDWPLKKICARLGFCGSVAALLLSGCATVGGEGGKTHSDAVTAEEVATLLRAHWWNPLPLESFNSIRCTPLGDRTACTIDANVRSDQGKIRHVETMIFSRAPDGTLLEEVVVTHSAARRPEQSVPVR